LSILTSSGLIFSFTSSKFLIPSPILTFLQTITNNIKTKKKEENNLKQTSKPNATNKNQKMRNLVLLIEPQNQYNKQKLKAKKQGKVRTQ
jgi:cellobiose-specific phosphotransferase system component IIB